jgi:hypothetical protein
MPMKTVEEIRRDNLAIAAKRAGSSTALAEKAGVSAVYLSRLKNRAVETRTGHVKAMGSLVARKIEAAIGEPVGWLDTDHSKAALPMAAIDDKVLPNEVAALFQAYFEASPSGRERILAVAYQEASAAAKPLPHWVRPIFASRKR